MTKTHKMLMMAALAGCMLAAPPRVEAGLMGKFKELLENTDTAMKNYQTNMWGEGGLGDSLIQGVKEKKAWHEVFDTAHEKQKVAQDQALTDVKAILKTLHEIAMWLPRKLAALFEKLMDSIEEFLKTLDRMNQGDTAAERLGNLANPPPPAEGEIPAVEEPVEAPAEEAPAAPRASRDGLRAIEGAFPGMLQMVREIEDRDRRREAVRRIREAFFHCLDKALARNSREASAVLLKESSEFYGLDAQTMHRGVQEVASRHPGPLAEDYVKVSGRLTKAATLQRENR